MEVYEVARKLLAGLKSFYEQNRASVRVAGNMSRRFRVKNAVKYFNMYWSIFTTKWSIFRGSEHFLPCSEAFFTCIELFLPRIEEFFPVVNHFHCIVNHFAIQ